MNEDIKDVIEYKIEKTYWLKGSSLTLKPGSKLFNCDDQFNQFGCKDCPKRGLISVCHFYFTKET